ncbi:cation diffusion facilitator family transporter [Myxococcota bacterium]|nr:cation diffusion facilitator family transporter [Myxococcota bacterium]
MDLEHHHEHHGSGDDHHDEDHHVQEHQGHHHGGHHHASGAALGFSIVLNVLITVAQAIGGFLSGSLSLLSDALHNFSDVVALVISWIANRLVRSEYSKERTFGFKRAEIIAALINGVTLLAIAANISIEAVKRLASPRVVGADLILWLAGLSILVNGLSVIFIHRDAKHSLNMRSAYLHLFTDMLTSVAVLGGGFLMKYAGWFWVDPVLALLISLYLVVASLGVLRQGLMVVMHFTPEGIDVMKIVELVSRDPQVENMHHVHLWRLNDNEIHMKAHVDFVSDLPLSEVTRKIYAMESLLRKEFGISNLVIQAEFGATDCKDVIVNQHSSCK